MQSLSPLSTISATDYFEILLKHVLIHLPKNLFTLCMKLLAAKVMSRY